MEDSSEYSGFFHVDSKYKVGDIVDCEFIDKIMTCVITKVTTLADHEDNFEASYEVTELIRGKMTEISICGSVYESELTLNKKHIRDRELDKILVPEPRKKELHNERNRRKRI